MAQAYGKYRERLDLWRDWYDSSFALVLHRALEEAARLQVFPAVVFDSVNSLQRQARMRRDRRAGFQQELYRQLLAHPQLKLNVEERFRVKLARWGLPTPIGILSRRAKNRFVHLSSLVPPRVLSAVFRTLWNGWCTARRFQRVSPCCLGCDDIAQDSIEHYCRCPVMHEFAFRRFGLKSSRFTPEHFLCIAKGMSDADLIAMAAVVYATYRATSFYRGRPRPGKTKVQDALEEYCKGASSVHVPAVRVSTSHVE
jgi:hypothetical protein